MTEMIPPHGETPIAVANCSHGHSRDLRKGRVSEPGRVYHVRAATEGRRPLFDDLFLGREVVRCLRFVHQRGDVESLAFVVMPDHLHWLFRLTGSRMLDGVMHAVKRHSARQINRLRGTQGMAVWQKGYFDRALRGEDDPRVAARYIISNPLRAGLCRKVGNYSLWDAGWL